MQKFSRYYFPLLFLLFLGIIGLAYYRVLQERNNLQDDLNRRAQVIAKSLAPASIRTLKKPPKLDEEDLAERLSGQGRTMGILLCNANGTMIARSAALEGHIECDNPRIQQSFIQKKQSTFYEDKDGLVAHHFVYPLLDNNGGLAGGLVVVHDSAYIERRVGAVINWTTFILVLITFLISTLTYFLSRYSFQRSIRQFLAWTKSSKEEIKLSPFTASLLKPVTWEFEKLSAHLRAARETAQEISETQMAVELWNPARLKAHAVSHLKNRPLIVVSNREPYMHVKSQGERKLLIPASGLVTAMDPLLRATSGLWIAHGAGDADRDLVNQEGKILVPPDSPSYTLKRVWLSREEEQGYYYGFSNEALWPLCLGTHHRPYFEEKDWETYVEVNKKFAHSVLEECGKEAPLILVQDYHFTLLPSLIREQRPDAIIGIFWHIPWPTPEAFQVCPWKREILKGMLGADFIGFHLPSFGSNFLETANSLLPVRVDWDRFSIEHGNALTRVKSFPISVQPWSEREVGSEQEIKSKISNWRRELELEGKRIAVSVDRIDYAKGIPERLGAIDRFLDANPSYKGRVSFIQLLAPSRTHIPRYQDLTIEIEKLVEQVNWKHGNDEWKPILYLKSHHDAQTVYSFLRMADLCIVSSLSDGMNLVAKEFIAAREENNGVLILSEFAGAARDFQEALQVNPYARADFSETIRIALEMPYAEQQRRMARMKSQIAANNIYKWGADLIQEMGRHMHIQPLRSQKASSPLSAQGGGL